MKHSILALSLIAGVSSAAQAAEPVSFSKDIVPLLKARCVMCHLTGQEPGNIKLAPKAAYTALVGVDAMETKLKRVEPGKPDESYLIRKIDGTHVAAGGTGERMPMGGDPLPAEQVQKIRDWIEQGAQNN